MIRSIYRMVVPKRLRLAVRTVLREVPIRVRDATADLIERETPPLPPPALRARVGTDSSRAQFLSVGVLTSALVLDLYHRHRNHSESYRSWVDFGCGSGRVARHLLASGEVEQLTGLDVDRHAVGWCSRNLGGTFYTVAPDPPTPIETGGADIVYCISVFTHLDEESQFIWLGEVRRMLRPGGLFIVSTHPSSVTYNRPDLEEKDHLQLQSHGFLFAKGTGAFNDDSAFHTEDYLKREWSKLFDLVYLDPGALGMVQDLSIWRAR